MRIKAVIFDLGETLVKMWVPELVYQRVLASLGVSRSTEEIKQALARAEREAEDSKHRSKYGKISYKEYWEKWDSIVLRHLGFTTGEKLVGEILARWFEYADCHVYPDVKDILTRLKRMSLKTGLISTAYEEDIDAICRTAGLDKNFFDIIVGVNTIKKEKPHPEVFKYALEKLGANPKEALFVGDHIEADYKGSQKVGMRPLLIQRTENATNRNPDLLVIRHLDEIFQYID